MQNVSFVGSVRGVCFGLAALAVLVISAEFAAAGSHGPHNSYSHYNGYARHRGGYGGFGSHTRYNHGHVILPYRSTPLLGGGRTYGGYYGGGYGYRGVPVYGAYSKPW